MLELTLNECIEIDGGVTWSNVVAGAGLVLIGASAMGAMVLAATPSITIAALGYACYNVGAIVGICGVCDV